MTDTTNAFDVIVVGSGSAGAVVARRLVDAGASVLLIEAGKAEASEAVHEPSRLFELWDSAEDWGYRTVPQAAGGGRELHWPRGKVLGGSSGLNGMIWVRGHRLDYDGWAAAGNTGWDFDSMLPLFKRAEDFDRGADAFRGAGGPVRVISEYERHPLIESAVEAAVEAGIPFNDDYNGSELEGVGYAQLTIRDGRRDSTATAFLGPVLDAPNLTVAASSLATRLLFEGDRCVGVEYVSDGRVEKARALYEVVVSAGTIESPKLLMLSGIGPADELSRHGLEVRIDLPGVGENLHDHVLAPVIFSSRRPVPPPIVGLQPLHAHLFTRSRSELERPDLQPLFFHLPLYMPGQEGPPDGFTLMAGVIRPESRGRLALASTDPLAAPLLDPACLSADEDVEALAAALELCRTIGRRPALDGWMSEELYPGDGVREPEAIREYIRQNVLTYHHQVGTCRMGVDELAVVDPELRVRGIEGLRVADASVMPEVTTGNTHAPAVMIGERAADLVGAALGASVGAAAG